MGISLVAVLVALGQAGSTCPTGLVISEDTKGHCCWPDQVWSKAREHCIGKPTCPAGTKLDAVNEACMPDCPPGKAIGDETAGHCCWPGQAWSKGRAACVGTPVCASSMQVSGEDCVSAGSLATPPPTPPSASPGSGWSAPPAPPPTTPVAGAPKIDANERYGTVDASANEREAAEDAAREPVLSPFHPASRDVTHFTLGFAIQASGVAGLVTFPGLRLGIDPTRYFGLHLQWGTGFGLQRVVLGLEFGTPFFQFPSVVRRIAAAFRVSTDAYVWVGSAGFGGVGVALGPMISPGLVFAVAVIHNLSIEYRMDLNISIQTVPAVAPFVGGNFVFGVRWSG